jgi:3-deoxy-D-arabino-heptulosonate 7-phosphate (DAHP) synthase
LPELPGAQLRPADYVRDMRIERVVPLLSPDALLEQLPLSGEQADVVIGGRRGVGAVLDTTPTRRSSTRRCSRSSPAI